MATTANSAPFAWEARARWWPVALGFTALAAPTLISLGRQTWSTEAGMSGPIVLATGFWLLWRTWLEARPPVAPGRALPGFVALALALALYAVGRAFDFISVEVGAIWLAGIAAGYLLAGGAAMRALWFPLFYLAYVVPIPGAILDRITAPLKTFVSWAATGLLDTLGYPIARSGVTLFVAQYQLLVEDACSGLNSLVSLSAISLFYIYIRHATSWRYMLFLLLWILPIAVFANIVRVVALVLITYYLGNEAAQGFLHSTAGMMMFLAALIGIFLIDSLMGPVRRRLGAA